MAGNVPYVGSKISLITTSDIRYEGILYALNREESTIAVQNVRSFGTEGRRSPEVPMSNEIYDFIIFRGKDLKDLTVMQGAAERPSSNSPFSAVPDVYDQNGMQNDSLYSQPPPRPPAPPTDPYGYQQQHHHHQQQQQQQQHQHHQQQYADHAPAPAANSYHNKAPGSLAATRNAYPLPPARSAAVPHSYTGGSYPSPPSPATRPVEKPSSVASTRHSYPAAESMDSPWQQQSSQLSERGAPASPQYEDSSSRITAPQIPPVEQAKVPTPARSADTKDWNADAREKEQARNGGKGGAQKKPLHEVLQTHPRARDQITKAIRSQTTSSMQSADLRAMSETSPAVYSFFIDFVNYCCPAHMAQSDEQQWESLCKALKKYFEKEFGANQNQKPPQPQRPNNTLGDFITIEAKPAKKNGKAVARVPQPGRGAGPKKDEASERCEDGGVQAPSSWVCPRCTLRNENFATECMACGYTRQQAALWAEFPPLG